MTCHTDASSPAPAKQVNYASNSFCLDNAFVHSSMSAEHSVEKHLDYVDIIVSHNHVYLDLVWLALHHADPCYYKGMNATVKLLT